MGQQCIGVKAVILDGNSVLLMKRSDKYKRHGFSGAWDIPGGRIQFGEEPVAALRREVKEETGMELKNIVKTLDARTVFLDNNMQIVRITFLCTTDDSMVRLSDEHTEIKWFDLNNIDVALKDKELKSVLDALRKELNPSGGTSNETVF